MDAAEGRSSPELAVHLESCTSCAELVRRYREIVVAAQIAWTSAPAELIQRAKNLMPETRRVWIAQRLGASLAAGARGPADEFQVLVGTDELSIRLMATRIEKGWQLMGRLPEGEWEVDASFPIQVDAKGFRFVVPSLEQSAFNLIGKDAVLQVPALSELF